MNACPPIIGCPDFGALLTGAFDAAVAFLAASFYGLPMWAILAVVLVLLGVAWRWGGLPGLAAAAFGLGFLLGRKPHEPEPHEHVPPGPDGEGTIIRPGRFNRTAPKLQTGQQKRPPEPPQALN